MNGSPERVGLALSGGGFRATLFHLGVLRALRDHDGLLSRVRHIASVSGGSIVAAHVALNWARYTGTEEQFDEAADELIAFVRSDVRGGIIREWLFRHVAVFPLLMGWKASRITSMFERKYRGLYGNAALGDLLTRTDGSNPPGLSILATSFTTGQLCAFGTEGVTLDMSRPEATHIATRTFPVSIAVAASSAFPPLFPPVPLDRDRLQATQEMYPFTQYLGDGGVYDNLGVRMLALLHASSKTPFDAIVLSDAGAKIDAHVGTRYGFVISRSIRASDVLMQRVSDLEYDGVGGRFGLEDASVFRVRIDDPVPAGAPLAHDPAVQRAVGRLRTDMDEFSKLEVNALVQHGQSVGARRLGSSVRKLWLPRSTRSEATSGNLIDRLAGGSEHRLRVWSPRDLTSWGLALFLLIVAGAVAYGPIRTKIEAKELEVKLQAARLEKQATDAKLTSARESVSASQEQLSQVRDERTAVIQQLVLTEAEKPRAAARTTFDRLFADSLQYKDQVVAISFGSFRATGFYINDRGLLMTSNHAVENARGAALQVVKLDGTTLPARLIAQNAEIDLALLQTSATEPTPFLKLSTERTWRPGDAIVVLGFVMGAPGLSANPGVVAELTGSSIVVEMDGTRRLTGGSGGPMITPDGTVVGIYLRTMGAAQPRRRSGTRADAAQAFVRSHVPGFR